MELIDKNKFLEYLDNDCHDVIEDCGDYSKLGYSDQQIENAINFAKVDASVKHGHWEFKDDFGNRNYDFIAVCSRCSKEEKASGYSHSEWISEWRYCNACGAKMFGGSDEE